MARFAPHKEASGAGPEDKDEYEDRERERTKNNGIWQKACSLPNIIITYGKETNRAKRRGRSFKRGSPISQTLKSSGTGPHLYLFFLQQHHYVFDRCLRERAEPSERGSHWVKGHQEVYSFRGLQSSRCLVPVCQVSRHEKG